MWAESVLVEHLQHSFGDVFGSKECPARVSEAIFLPRQLDVPLVFIFLADNLPIEDLVLGRIRVPIDEIHGLPHLECRLWGYVCLLNCPAEVPGQGFFGWLFLLLSWVLFGGFLLARSK